VSKLSSDAKFSDGDILAATSALAFILKSSAKAKHSQMALKNYFIFTCFWLSTQLSEKEELN
jgi:hypothetical protein